MAGALLRAAVWHGPGRFLFLSHQPIKIYTFSQLNRGSAGQRSGGVQKKDQDLVLCFRRYAFLPYNHQKFHLI